MKVYLAFLNVMCVLFVISATVLLVTSLRQLARRRGHRAAIYLGLTALAGIVAAGFYFFGGLL